MALLLGYAGIMFTAMTKHTSKAERYWWSVINKQVANLSDVEMHYGENDKRYAKHQASKARRRASKLMRNE